MAKSKYSRNRPVRPEHDPMLGHLRKVLTQDQRSLFAKANVSGLAPATIKNIINGHTRRPQGVTIQMAYKMLGYKLVAQPIEKKGK